MSFSSIATGGTGVTAMKVSAMSPAVVAAGKLSRQPGRGGFVIVTSLIAVAVGLPGLLVDCLLDDFNQRFGIQSSACKRLGINGDVFLGGLLDELGQNGAASCLHCG